MCALRMCVCVACGTVLRGVAFHVCGCGSVSVCFVCFVWCECGCVEHAREDSGTRSARGKGPRRIEGRKLCDGRMTLHKARSLRNQSMFLKPGLPKGLLRVEGVGAIFAGSELLRCSFWWVIFEKSCVALACWKRAPTVPPTFLLLILTFRSFTMKLGAALTAGTVLATSFSNVVGGYAGVVELNSLTVDQSSNLLRNWNVRTLAAACGGVGGCTGDHLLELADTLRSGEVREFSNRVLASVSALDLMTFGRQVEDALGAGGVSEAFVNSPRRQLAAQSSSGINIRRNDSSVTLGTAGDVSLARTGYKELTIGNSAIVEDDLAVAGDATVSGDFTVGSTSEFTGDVTMNGHLEVDKTISTGFGRITRDFHQFYTTTSGALWFHSVVETVALEIGGCEVHARGPQ